MFSQNSFSFPRHKTSHFQCRLCDRLSRSSVLQVMKHSPIFNSWAANNTNDCHELEEQINTHTTINANNGTPKKD
jgi:hypothetical protein